MYILTTYHELIQFFKLYKTLARENHLKQASITQASPPWLPHLSPTSTRCILLFPPQQCFFSLRVLSNDNLLFLRLKNLSLEFYLKYSEL